MQSSIFNKTQLNIYMKVNTIPKPTSVAWPAYFLHEPMIYLWMCKKTKGVIFIFGMYMNDERLGIYSLKEFPVFTFNWTLTAELCRTVYMHRHYIRHTSSSLILLETPLSRWSGTLWRLVPGCHTANQSVFITTGGNKSHVNSLGAFSKNWKQTP